MGRSIAAACLAVVCGFGAPAIAQQVTGPGDWGASKTYLVTADLDGRKLPQLKPVARVDYLKQGDRVRIECQTTGQKAYGSRIWTRVGGLYVPDKFIKTFTDGFLPKAPRCAKAPPAPPEQTVDRSKPVYFIHGITPLSGADCRQFDTMIANFRQFGHTGDMLRVGYYRDDRNCDSLISHIGSHDVHIPGGHQEANESTDLKAHNNDAPIEHLGYHLAWHIYTHHSSKGEPVDVVAHSMGGLITRYAIAATEARHPDFPPTLLIEDVVTMGTPHGGARFLGAFGRRFSHQADQMSFGSGFIKKIVRDASDPDGSGGTEWTLLGSDEDGAVAADRAVGSDRDRDPIEKYFGPAHRVWYTDPNGIDHSGYKTEDSTIATAQAWVSFGGKPYTFTQRALWPVRAADVAIAYPGY